MSEALTRAQAAVQQLQDRLRATAQLLIAEIGAAGPENAESVAGRAVAKIQQQAEEIARLKDIIRREAWLEQAVDKEVPGPYVPWEDHRRELDKLEAEIAWWKAEAKWAAGIITYAGFVFTVVVQQRAKRILEEA